MSLLLWTAEVDLAAQQRVLDFLHEQPLAADVGQRRVLQLVARGPDDDDLARLARRSPRSARRRYSPRHEGELTAARAERGVT